MCNMLQTLTQKSMPQGLVLLHLSDRRSTHFVCLFIRMLVSAEPHPHGVETGTISHSQLLTRMHATRQLFSHEQMTAAVHGSTRQGTTPVVWLKNVTLLISSKNSPCSSDQEVTLIIKLWRIGALASATWRGVTRRAGVVALRKPRKMLLCVQLVWTRARHPRLPNGSTKHLNPCALLVKVRES
jgi:hypothetical protein